MLFILSLLSVIAGNPIYARPPTVAHKIESYLALSILIGRPHKPISHLIPIAAHVTNRFVSIRVWKHPLSYHRLASRLAECHLWSGGAAHTAPIGF